MAFDLPRTSRDLRFSGESRAALAVEPDPESVAPAPLGKARPRASARDVHPLETAPTAPIAPAPVRVPLDSVDDTAETQALDRDLLLSDFPTRRREPKAPTHAALGVPNFRRTAAAPEPAVVYIPTVTRRRRLEAPTSRAFSLLLWTLLALIGGTVSYRFAPPIVDDVMSAVRALSSRR